MKFLRNLFRLSWVYKPPVERETCGACGGAEVVWPDGTPAAVDSRVARNYPNLQNCQFCQGRGFTMRLKGDA